MVLSISKSCKGTGFMSLGSPDSLNGDAGGAG